MKRVRACLVALMVLLFALPISVCAKQAFEPPVLKDISFNNAKIEGDFSPNQFEYGITLEEPSVTPTLNSYKISDSAYIFVNYELDDAKHQTAIVVDVQNDNIKTSYVFRYLNVQKLEINSNNRLAHVECMLGEIYPALNEDSTSYSLYIPSDLTEITLSAAPEDTGAYCEVPGTQYIKPNQKPTITIQVTASDASTKKYTFKVKRLNKNVDEVKELMAQPDFTSLVEGELFYQKSEFKLIILCSVGGVLLLALLFSLLKRLAIKTADDDENEFFDFE